MHPILFTIPGIDFPVRSFGLMVAAGFLLGTWILGKLVARMSRNPSKDVERYGALPVWVLIGVVLGARAVYVIV
ncbi:MAG: prolipoprotein diacylglyceryl transferase [Planctomycetes bacterium]|nr:prolipoprotein diacylglyceryl transferase [Planctomycetota bacterium]